MLISRRAALSLAAAFALTACGAPRKPKQPIAFELPDAHGNSRSPTDPDLAGKPILLYIFGVWCGPCKALTPEMQRFQTAYGPKGLNVVGVHFAVAGGTVESYQATLRNYAAANHLSFPLLVGGHTEDVAGALPTVGHVKGYPTTLLYGMDGIARKVWTGFSPDMPREMEDTIRRLLTEGG